MLHHFVNKGYSLKELLQLSSSDKFFLIASASLARDEEVEKFKAFNNFSKAKTE